MKIYRCIIGGLLAIFIIFGVWYIVSNISEQRSIDDGTLIWRVEHVADYHLC